MTALLIVGVAIVLTVPSNWMVRWVLNVVRPDLPEESNGAGRWIGILERLLIYVLVIAGQAAAAGIVVAAKSILRYPEISAEPQRIAPEYVLIGSLASWLLAFAAGVAVQYFR
ncbi:MAG: hypothetical protein OEM39_00965 [Acidimicrobiia bacterium]|nr:hypothetical protein [Acidimicrobiia bacterium]MDH3463759.1 hypothetical protein [Acidimicrobiia bacterium]